MATVPENRSVGELLRDLASDSAALVQQELALARTETQDKLHQTMSGAAALMAAALLALAGFMVLLQAAVYGLEKFGFAPWLAAVIVGGVVLVIGLLLLQKARHDLSAQNLAAHRTAANLRKDLNLVRGHVS
jgi:xanthine/uracil permease